MSLTNVYALERDLTKVLFEMERYGIRINPKYCQDALNYEQRCIEIVKDKFKGLTGHEFIDSNKLFKEIFDQFGDKYPTTEKGNPSFNAESLAAIDTPVARLIKKYRDHEKRAGTYYSSFIHYAGDDLLIHASANQAATVTGRMSYSNPNLQNIPKEDTPEDLDKKYVVRGSFVPRGTFVSIDYDQMEYRMLMDYAGEMKIIDAIMQGEDVHQVAADMMKVPRKYAKNCSFALLYGAGIGKLARMLGVTEKEAREIRDLYFSKLPKVKKFIRQVIYTGEVRGFVYNWMGGRYHINRFEESYRLCNHLIQGGCAMVIKRAMCKIEQELGFTGMCVQVHDELLFDMTAAEKEKIPQIIDTMASVYEAKNGIKLTAGCDWSDTSWATRDKNTGLPC